jgi:hypothetical protein
MGRATFEQGLPDWKDAWPWVSGRFDYRFDGAFIHSVERFPNVLGSEVINSIFLHR